MLLLEQTTARLPTLIENMRIVLHGIRDRTYPKWRFLQKRSDGVRDISKTLQVRAWAELDAIAIA